MVKEMLQAIGTIRGVFFSFGTSQPKTPDPKFDCANAIVGLFNQVTQTAHVAIYSLTNQDIVNAMILAQERGVGISVVADATESRNHTQAMMLKKLVQAGITVNIAVRQHALMHNKVGIFDGQTVCTGSFNWTNNAELNNDENMVIIDGPDVAADYEQYVFQRIIQNETLINISQNME